MNNHQAFTLIELLIISAVIVLFSGTLLANYNNFTQQKNLEREVSKIADVLALAKGKAQSADLNYDCTGSDEFGGYVVEVDSNSYNFKQCCRDSLTKNQSVCGVPVQEYNFPAQFSNASGFQAISFYPLSEGASAANFDIRSSSINKCSTITISSTALITTSSLQEC